jgi:predicted DsbA family dithiol-disulfide isomerase
MSEALSRPNDRVFVDIVSDFVCPWCWLGIRYFEAARTNFKGEIVLTWRPYMLDPSVPAKGLPYKAYMKSKFGDRPDSRWRAMREHLESAGPEAGIDFRFSDIPMRPNTLGAHRLMRWAGGQNKAAAVAENLFQTFFTAHKDIGDPDVLAELAGAAGLDKALVRDLLEGGQDAHAVKQEIAEFRRLGISGVPTFIYNGQFAIQGAQPVETHLKALASAQKPAQKPEERP